MMLYIYDIYSKFVVKLMMYSIVASFLLLYRMQLSTLLVKALLTRTKFASTEAVTAVMRV